MSESTTHTVTRAETRDIPRELTLDELENVVGSGDYYITYGCCNYTIHVTADYFEDALAKADIVHDNRDGVHGEVG